MLIGVRAPALPAQRILRVRRGAEPPSELITRSCIRQECGYKQEIAPTVVA